MMNMRHAQEELPALMLMWADYSVQSLDLRVLLQKSL